MNNQSAQYTYMTETPVFSLLVKMAIPTTISMLITSIYNLSDTYFVGQLSTSASGAIGIVASLMAIIQAIGFTFGHGAGSIVSRKLGAKADRATATRFVSTSFFSALVMGTLVLTFGLIFLSPLMTLLGSTDTILPHACDYGFYILLSAPVMMASLVLNNVLRYEGKAKFAMFGLVSGGILNIILDPILIFGCNMGTAGAGLATGISQVVGFCVLLVPFCTGETASQIAITKITRSPRELRQILATGAPSFARQGLGSVSGMLLNIAAKNYGDAAVSAMSIINRIFTFLFSLSVGIGQGLQPIASFNYGAKKPQRVYLATVYMLVLSGVLTTLAVAGCLIFEQPLIALFRDDPAVWEIGVPALRYQCLASLGLPLIVTGNMLFQSIGKSKTAFFLASCRQGVFFLPLVALLPSLWGLTGVQLAQPLADLCTILLSATILFPYMKTLHRGHL